MGVLLMTMWSRDLTTATADSDRTLLRAPDKNEYDDLPQFVLGGHAFIAVAGSETSDVEGGLLAHVEGRASLVGRICCAGTGYLIYAPVEVEPPPPSPAEILTRRELQVAMLIADGHCDKEIARRLGISGYTVREHIRRIFAKLNLGRRSAIVAYLLNRSRPVTRRMER